MPSIPAWRWIILEILEPDRGLQLEEAFGWVAEEDWEELEITLAELQLEGRVRVSNSDGDTVLLRKD